MKKAFFLLMAVGFTSLSYGQKKIMVESPEKNEKKEIDYKVVGAPMPKIRLVTLDTFKIDDSPKGRKKKQVHTTVTQEYTENDFKNKKALFVMMFNPTCGHCEEQTDNIEKNISKFGKSKFILMANPVMKSYLPDFIKNHKVKDYPSMYIGIDSSEFITKTFMYSALPQITIYDKDRKLVKIYNGEISIDSLLQYTNPKK